MVKAANSIWFSELAIGYHECLDLNDKILREGCQFQ